MSALARPLLLWSVAGALGGIGTGLLFDAAPGLNWGIWTLASAGGVLLCARTGGAPTRAALLVPLTLAAGFGVAAAVTAAQSSHALIAGGVAVLLAIAVLLAGTPGWEALTAPFMLGLPVVAPVLVAGEAIRRAFELVGLVATPRHRPLLRGALFALPVVGLCALMLANADPVLATLRDDLADTLVRLAFVPRLMFFGALFTAVLGGCGIVLHRGAASGPAPEEPARTPRLADTERLVVLGAVGALFSAFLLLQLSYLRQRGGHPGIGCHLRGVRATGLRRADHGGDPLHDSAGRPGPLGRARPPRRMDAHRGGRGRRAGRGAADLGAPPPLALRVGLWIHGRAALRPRLHGRGRALSRDARLGPGPRPDVGVAGPTGGRNRSRRDGGPGLLEPRSVDRPAERRALPSNPSARHGLLVWELSPNAAPALVRAIPELPPILAESVRDGLRQRYGTTPRGAPCRWFEWNRGRERAGAALRAGGIVRGDAQLHPLDCVLVSPAGGPPA